MLTAPNSCIAVVTMKGSNSILFVTVNASRLNRASGGLHVNVITARCALSQAESNPTATRSDFPARLPPGVQVPQECERVCSAQTERKCDTD
jgi:hypothetical protein